jgi:hypothetical protein
MPLDKILTWTKFMLLVSVFLHDLAALLARLQHGVDSPGKEVL